MSLVGAVTAIDRRITGERKMADTGKNNKIKSNRLTALEIYIFY